MDPTTPSPRPRWLQRLREGRARTLAILIADAILVVVLFRLLLGGESPEPPRSSTVSEAEALPAATSAAGSRAEGASLDLERADTAGGGLDAIGVSGAVHRPSGLDIPLTRRVETAIANAVRRASRATGEKVNARNVVVAVHVVDAAEGGYERISIQSDMSLRPASNMKLVTSAAALVLLGADATFETPILARGAVAAGVLQGDLIARAVGDPFHDPAGDGGLARWLEPLAADLRRNGIESVRGALILDESTFLVPGPGPEWPSASEYWKEYCALAGGFSANAGCLTASVRPGSSSGARAEVLVRPQFHGLTRRGEVRSVGRGHRLDIAVGVSSGNVTVRGEIPLDVHTWSARFAHTDPVELFGHAVLGGLAARGIEIEGGFRRERDPEVSAAREVARMVSPLAETLEPILADSNNSVSDQLFLAVGHAVARAGTREGGRRATATALERLGVSPDGLVQVDGSGLSRADRVSARQLTSLLLAVGSGDPDVAAAYEGALAVAGERGTLEKRMRDSVARGRVRAKTGFISGTSGLSGFVETLSGRRLVFSILVAYPPTSGLNTSCWKPMQDDICAVLVASE